MKSLRDRLAASDDPRDADSLAWLDALRSGDSARVDATRDALLVAIHERIMDDDPNYAVAGWDNQRL